MTDPSLVKSNSNTERASGPDNNHWTFKQLSLRQKCWVGTILPANRVKMIRNVTKGPTLIGNHLKGWIHLIEASARLFWTLGDGLVISNINHLSPCGQVGQLSKKKKQKKKIPAGLGACSLLYSISYMASILHIRCKLLIKRFR